MKKSLWIPSEFDFTLIEWILALKEWQNPGGSLLPKSYMDVHAKPQKFDFLYSNFLPNYPPISIPFLIEKHPICPNWVLFTIICSKYTQFLNLGSFVSDENPPIAIPNFVKSTPKGRHKYIYQVSVRTPG